MKNKLATLAFCAAIFALQPTVVKAQEGANTTERSDDDDDFDYGWIGLIGLAGLLGLRKKDRDDRDVHANPNIRR